MNYTAKQLGNMIRQLVKLRTYPGSVTSGPCKELESFGLTSSENSKPRSIYHDSKLEGVELTASGVALADDLIALFSKALKWQIGEEPPSDLVDISELRSWVAEKGINENAVSVELLLADSWDRYRVKISMRKVDDNGASYITEFADGPSLREAFHYLLEVLELRKQQGWEIEA